MSRTRRKCLDGPLEETGYKNLRVVARTENQKEYIKAIRANDVTLCYGPPGTGKTHIAVGMAVQMMRAGEIEKIVVTRPVVPTGRDIGYLPGGMDDKLSPWLQPIYDELDYYVSPELVKVWKDTRKLEVVPVSYMRGRTFCNSFVILDESQNALYEELKMFFTRIGVNSKVVAVGDLNQSDLPSHLSGDYEDVIELLEGMEGLSVVELDRTDIVRHRMIGEIEERLSRFHD